MKLIRIWKLFYIYCINLVSNLKDLTFDYEICRNNMKDNIIKLTNKLQFISFFKENNYEINKEENHNNINKNNTENLKLSKFEFPIIKYELQLIKIIGCRKR